MAEEQKSISGAPSRRAIFAAGCFWAVEAAFRREAGVVDVKSGYCGGALANPTYEQVCRGDTGHAEAVAVLYNPSETTYDALLMAFWACHDPTQLNRQGPDIGRQYRSAIFYTDDEQQALAEASKKREGQNWAAPIVTEIESAGEFYLAEDYHQNYHAKMLQHRRLG